MVPDWQQARAGSRWHLHHVLRRAAPAGYGLGLQLVPWDLQLCVGTRDLALLVSRAYTSVL